MRPILSEEAQREVQATPVRNHEGWQTVFYNRWVDNLPASATRTIPVDLDSAQTLEFLGFDGNTAGELYDSWFPAGEESLLKHTKDYLAEIYGQAPGGSELRCLLPAMGMSRAFSDNIWEIIGRVRRDGRFANNTVERTNIKQWAEVEITARFKTLQNLNDRILGHRVGTHYHASYELTHRDENNNDGVPNGFLKRNGLLEPTYHHFPPLPAGPRLWAIDPAMMGNFRAAPLEDGRIAYIAQEPTGFTVPNNDGTQNVYVGRNQLPTGYVHQHGRGGAPRFGQGQPIDVIFQAGCYGQGQLQAQLGGQGPAWNGQASGMQQAVAGYLNQQGHGATPSLVGISQNQLQAQLGGQLSAWDRSAPNAQLRNSPPLQTGAQAYAQVWTGVDRNRMNMDTPPPYSAQPPYQ